MKRIRQYLCAVTALVSLDSIRNSHRKAVESPIRRLPQSLFALILFLTAANPAPCASIRGEIPIGGTLRDATLQGLNGPARKLSEFLGKPLIINVWASWCGPCRQEMESLERLAWRGQNQYFAIIGISTDDDPDKAKILLRSTNATISQFIDTRLQMENMLGASRLPLTVFIGADGQVLRKVYGARDWDGADALRLIDETFRVFPAAKRASRRVS